MRRPTARLPITCIVPPHILAHIARTPTPATRRLADWALHTLLLSERVRGERLGLGAIAPLAVTPAGEKRRTIYDARNREELPGTLVRGEGDPAGKDAAVNEAYEGAGATWDLFFDAFERNSIDDRGMRLDATVHYGVKFDNAFWNGRQMVYGDGDGVIFERFTRCVDVIGHELAHGVTQFEAGLRYEGETGALNESFSDVFGSLVKQRVSGEAAEEADWLIGAGLFRPGIKALGIRSMKAPGTAYDDPRIGRDPQPDHMRRYVETDEDAGGVHINSGIPNRAFYLAATALGGYAWEGAGRVWYLALRDRLRPAAGFADAARQTVALAGELLGKGAAGKVRRAWGEVGVPGGPRRARRRKEGKVADRGHPQRRVRGLARPRRGGQRRAA
jgi:Zn-dependent metalloprotease